MAFTGTPVVKSLGKYIAHITGISLGSGASGTIGLPGDTGAGIQLPAGFPTAVDAAAAALGLDMTDLISTHIERADAVGGEATHIHCQKALGPFRITLTIDTGGTSGALDIFVQYPHTMTR